MTLTLSRYNTTIRISRPTDDLVLDEVLDMVRALLLAAGYQETSVNAALGA